MAAPLSDDTIDSTHVWKSGRKKPPIKEEQHLYALIDYCQKLSIPYVHIPNEGRRFHALDARRGIQKGFPDIFICLPKIPYGGLFLELKRDDRSVVSPEQWMWIERLNKLSYIATVSYHIDESMRFISDYKKLPTNTWKWDNYLKTLHREKK